jgi:hypothetical protein
MTTRRDILQGFVSGAGAAGLASAWPLRSSAQSEYANLARRLDADLEKHAGFGDKFSAGDGDNATASWIAERLRASGYGVQESAFDAPYFVRRAARLSTGTLAVDVVPQAPVVTTGSGGVTARLVLVEGETVETSVADRIALVIAPFGRHAALFPDRGIGRTVKHVVAQGAAAVVLVTTGPTGEAVALNAPERPFVDAPMAILAPKLSVALVEAARGGAEATLLVDGEATHRPCRNIVAKIERGQRWIALSTPRSGWYGCVAERGTGTAVFLELADWAADRFSGHSVFAMNTGGHEYFFAGSHRVIDRAPPPADTVVWAHIGATLAAREAEQRDGRWVMLDSADPQRSLMASDGMRELAAGAFRGLTGLEEATPVRAQAGELSTFTDRGYENAFAVIGVHRWFHTVGDTLDCVHSGLLVPVLEAHRRTIELAVARAG